MLAFGLTCQLVRRKRLNAMWTGADVCSLSKENLPLLNMPADLLNKTKVFEKQYKRLVMERRDADSRTV